MVNRKHPVMGTGLRPRRRRKARRRSCLPKAAAAVATSQSYSFPRVLIRRGLPTPPNSSCGLYVHSCSCLYRLCILFANCPPDLRRDRTYGQVPDKSMSQCLRSRHSRWTRLRELPSLHAGLAPKLSWHALRCARTRLRRCSH